MWWLRKQLLRIKLYITENYILEKESLIIWYAIMFALGAAFYLSIPYELSTALIVIFLESVLAILYIFRNKAQIFKLLTYVLVFALGLTIAKADALFKLKQIDKNLSETIYINGQVKVIDYNSNNRPRLLITKANNFDRNLKGDYKISISKLEPWMKEGVCVELVAQLPKSFTPNPLSNYNMNRNNFYKEISAIGYSIGPVFEKDCKNKDKNDTTIISNIRNKIKTIVDSNTAPNEGSIIKALTIGDRSLISNKLNENYRTSGLAHVLSISGMHMSIIALLVFLLVRLLLLPIGYGQYDFRKLAAIISIFVTFLYFLISGQTISCIRAFVMTTLVLLGILFNRRAITLRLWAFALVVVVLLTPSAVINPGFLMSFSATLGLISYYEKKSHEIHEWLNKSNIISKIFAYIVGIIITDLVASIMTLPYTMYYFNQISVYTTLGNMLAGPIIAFWVMPMLLLFLITLPLNIYHYPLLLLEKGVYQVNQIAHFVANLPGATFGEGISPITDFAIFIITFGLLWLCIWQAKWRRIGLIFILIGIINIYTTPNADIVFDNNGTTIAYRNKNNKLTITQWRKNRFLERIWTGSNTKGKFNYPQNEVINCSKDKCIYKDIIELKEGQIKYKDKLINLNHAGFIDIKKGIYTPIKLQNRIWD